MIRRLEWRLYFVFAILAFASLGLVLLSFGPFVAASNNDGLYQYKFSWGFVPVAKLEIDFSQHESQNLILSRGETLGLSKIIKSYSARVMLELDPSGRSSHYELSGLDGGSKELRKIKFSYGELPQLIEFKDRTSPLGLEPEAPLDKDSVDPLSVFAWFFTKQVVENRCVNQFKVFDGKKRFLVQAQIIEDENLLSQEIDQILNCRIIMMENSIQIAEEIAGRQEVNFWPFNKKDQVIDLVIGKVEPEIFYIKEIKIHSPLGKIIGRLLK